MTKGLQTTTFCRFKYQKEIFPSVLSQQFEVVVVVQVFFKVPVLKATPLSDLFVSLGSRPTEDDLRAVLREFDETTGFLDPSQKSFGLASPGTPLHMTPEKAAASTPLPKTAGKEPASSAMTGASPPETSFSAPSASSKKMDEKGKDKAKKEKKKEKTKDKEKGPAISKKSTATGKDKGKKHHK